MVDVKEAAKLATEYLREIIGRPISNQRVEEVELSDDEKFWTITISFSDDVMGFGPRQYKQFKVRVADGKVMAMRIRVLQ